MTRAHSYTLDHLFNDWQPSAALLLEVLFYDEVNFATWRPRPGQTIIFSDLDRLTPGQMDAAVTMADRAVLAGETILNHPAKFVSRYRLLHRLNAAGFNSFTACKAVDIRKVLQLRFPIFLRGDSGHDGSFSEPLSTPFHLALAIPRQIGRILFRRVKANDILAVEFEDVADPGTGLIAKYSYLKIGESMIARHLIFSDHWVVKYGTVCDAHCVKLEADFVAQRPFEHEIARVFKIAGVDYGRIDFSVNPISGAVKVWEINTNPSIGGPRRATAALRLALQEDVMSQILEGFKSL